MRFLSTGQGIDELDFSISVLPGSGLFFGDFFLGPFCFFRTGVMLASFHAVGKSPDLHDWLKSSSFSLAADPRCLIISLQTPSLSGAFFVLSFLIASLSSALVKSVVMVGETLVCS